MLLSGETIGEKSEGIVLPIFAISQGQIELTEAFRVASRAET